jgi:hypothetical protein
MAHHESPKESQSPEERCKEFVVQKVDLGPVSEEGKMGIADGLECGLKGTEITLDSICYDPAGHPWNPRAPAWTVRNSKKINIGPGFLRDIEGERDNPEPIPAFLVRDRKRHLALNQEKAASSEGETKARAEQEVEVAQRFLEDATIPIRRFATAFGATTRERAAIIVAHECAHVITEHYTIDVPSAIEDLKSQGIVLSRSDFLGVSAGTTEDERFPDLHAVVSCGHADQLTEKLVTLYRLIIKNAGLPR